MTQQPDRLPGFRTSDTIETKVMGMGPEEQPNLTPCQNTDRELWREREGDYYSDSIFVTAAGGIGLNVGGHCIVKPLREWHALAARDEKYPDKKPWIEDPGPSRQQSEGITPDCGFAGLPEHLQPTSSPDLAPRESDGAGARNEGKLLMTTVVEGDLEPWFDAHAKLSAMQARLEEAESKQIWKELKVCKAKLEAAQARIAELEAALGNH